MTLSQSQLHDHMSHWKNVEGSRRTISYCHIQAYPSRNYIPVVILSPNYTSLPSTVATFLTTCLIAVLQPSRYSVFHSRDTPIQLSLLR